MSRERIQRFREAYIEMAAVARYRPAAPSDGVGNIQLNRDELASQGRLEAEATKYAVRFSAEEDDLSFRVGCSNFSTNRAFVWIVEAARCLCGASDDIALKLLKMAANEIEEVERKKLPLATVIADIQTEYLPLPPKAIIRFGRAVTPMSMVDAKYWLNSYNLWSDTFRKAEFDMKYPLSPDWASADLIHVMERGYSGVFYFAPKHSDRHGIIRLRHWNSTERYARIAKPAKSENIVWGAWLGARRSPTRGR